MQLKLFDVYDTKWLIEHCTKSTTKIENEILEKTGRIGSFSGVEDEAELIRQFRMYYAKRHEPHFGEYTQHPRNCARFAIWKIRYVRFITKRRKMQTPKWDYWCKVHTALGTAREKLTKDQKRILSNIPHQHTPEKETNEILEKHTDLKILKEILKPLLDLIEKEQK